tara:strand:+ start:1931 stop:2797 length:867 start_codon:yes stop_codon:yes gene_type:complete
MDNYDIKDLQKVIEENWNKLEEGKKFSSGLKKEIDIVLSLLDQGRMRVCEKQQNIWVVNQWIKKAILLSFRINNNVIFNSGIQNSRSGKYSWFDKVDLKTSGWNEDSWTKANFRSVPGATVRYSSFISENVVLMPCFVNVGAYVDSGSMIDTWATVGSCAQIGKNVHISGGTGIGGVLEPLQANPVVIEDNCFIGARSEIAEGVIVGEGSVISMGVFIGLSTKIVHRDTGEIFFGEVPPYSVVVPGTLPNDTNDKSGIQKPNLACAVIVKTVDEKTRSKTSINELLRS